MRKTVLVVSILAFALSACGTAAGVFPGGSSNGSRSGFGSSSSGGFAAPTVPGLQLAAGMIKLDGTPYEVTPQEAAKLLPLWKSLQQTESAAATAAATQSPTAPPTPESGTPSGARGFGFRFNQADMQQVASQLSAIENAMTPDQLQAIQQMNLNGQDVADILKQAGIQMGNSGQGNGQFRTNGGTFTPPQGTFTPPEGTPSASGTPGAFSRGGFGARGGFASFIPPSVVDGVVQWLQKKAGS